MRTTIERPVNPWFTGVVTFHFCTNEEPLTREALVNLVARAISRFPWLNNQGRPALHRLTFVDPVSGVSIENFVDDGLKEKCYSVKVEYSHLAGSKQRAFINFTTDITNYVRMGAPALCTKISSKLDFSLDLGLNSL